MTKLLMDYVENKLSPTAVAKVEAQLEKDAQARETVAWLRQFQQWREQVQLPAPSLTVTERIVARHARKFSKMARLTLLQRVTAALTFDSRAGHLSGARGADLPHTRQLAYSTPSFDLLIDVRRTEHAHTLAGQILPKSEEYDAPYIVQIVHHEKAVDTTVSDALGEFLLLTAHTGEHQLIVSLNERYEALFPTLTL